MHKEQKRQTLLHELMHCYVWSYVCGFNNISEEALCDISANSHDIIHEIVENYFKNTIIAEFKSKNEDIIFIPDAKETYSYMAQGTLDKTIIQC